jgi:nitrate/nitrite transporter NarK
LLYLDRVCVSIAEGYIRDDLGLGDREMAWFLGVFFWTYALGQVPSGWLSERFGPRAMLAAYILGWSACTLALGWVGGFVSLIVMRAGLGIAQAGAYPSSGLILRRWIPFGDRGRASSLVAFGGRVGGAVAPLLTMWMILWFTPLSTPTDFGAGDILDPAGIAARIVVEPDPSKRAEVRRQAIVERIADGFPPVLLERCREEAKSISADDLTARLNDLLARKDFFDPAWMETVEFEREVRGLAEAGNALDEASRRRLNRLAIEAAFPRKVRKLYGAGWRPTMFVYGAVGLGVAALFWIVVRDTPQAHPAVNTAELNVIAPAEGGATPVESAAAVSAGAPPAFPWRTILSSSSLWAMSMAQFGTNVGWALLVTNLPRYLDERFQVPLADRATMQFVPLLVGIAGMLAGGVLTDRLVPILGLRWGRASLIALARFMSVLAYLSCPWLDSAWGVVIALSVVAFSVDLGVGATWAYAQDVGGRFAASVLGWGNMWGNLGAALAPVLFNRVLELSGGNWDHVFHMCAAAFAISGFAALGIDATKPIDKGE